jgi:hypothetical protein
MWVYPFLCPIDTRACCADSAKVYCKNCYESRHKGGSKVSTVVWRRDEKSALLCTVDGCTTKVSMKSNWVGLFL